MNASARLSFCSPSNEAEDIKGQVENGKGSKGDKEEHDSKTPPSPDGQTGLKHKHRHVKALVHLNRFEETCNVRARWSRALTKLGFL